MEKVLQSIHQYFFPAEEEQTAVNGLWFYGSIGFIGFLAAVIMTVIFITN